MAVRFIIDSASDILPEEAKKLGMIHLPLKVLFGEQEYADAVNLTHAEFYEKLAQSENLPGTSQVGPADFADAYEKVTAAGDTAVAVTLSSKLSGTYQSAMIAAEDYEGKVFVVDSLNATIGERILVMKGLEYASAGLTAEQIKEKLDQDKHRIRLAAIVDTLEYLKKGGRVSSTVAFVGGLLSIKPLIAVEDGKVEVTGKARGMKQAQSQLNENLSKYNGINVKEPFGFVYSGGSDEYVKKYLAENPQLCVGWNQEIPVHSVGCTIGTHVGPGAIGVAFFEAESTI